MNNFLKDKLFQPASVVIYTRYKAIVDLDGDSVLVETGFSCGGKFKLF